MSGDSERKLCHSSALATWFVLFALLQLTACGGTLEVGVERTITPDQTATIAQNDAMSTSSPLPPQPTGELASAQSPTPPTDLTPSRSLTLTETFTSPLLGLELNYPVGWQSDALADIFVWFYAPAPSTTRVGVVRYAQPAGATLDTVLDEVLRGGDGPRVTYAQTLTVGGQPAIQVFFAPPEEHRPDTVILVADPVGEWWTITEYGKTAILDQLVGTLHWLDREPVPLDTSTWPVYANDEYGIYLRYPPTFFFSEGDNDAEFQWDWSVVFIDEQYQVDRPPQTPGIWIHAYPNPEGISPDDWLAHHGTAAPFGAETDTESPVYHLWPVQAFPALGLEGRYFVGDAMGLRIPTLLLPHADWMIEIACGDFGPDDLEPVFTAMLGTLELEP